MDQATARAVLRQTFPAPLLADVGDPCLSCGETITDVEVDDWVPAIRTPICPNGHRHLHRSVYGLTREEAETYARTGAVPDG